MVDFNYLIPNWDGYGLLVSKGPIESDHLLSPAKRRFWGCVTVALLGILLLHVVKKKVPVSWFEMPRRRLVMSIGQSGGLCVVALALGIFLQSVSAGGYLGDPNAVASIQKAYAGVFIPKVSESAAERLLGSGAVFVDARFSRDYKDGHLQDALNVPVDNNDVERAAIMAPVSKNARLVVYCQSSGCAFAEKVALQLIDDGFKDIAIFKGGWNKWVTDGKKQREEKTL